MGTVPIRMSMIKPMPFWPSFEPWKKLTPVQVRISKPRIQNGGGSVPSGASYNFLSLTTAFKTMNSVAAIANPKTGESSSDLPMLPACAQSTPLVPDRAFINWLAIPTPMIDPIKVCELDAGKPEPPGSEVPQEWRRSKEQRPSQIRLRIRLAGSARPATAKRCRKPPRQWK